MAIGAVGAAVHVDAHAGEEAEEEPTLGAPAPAPSGPPETQRWVPSLSGFGGFIAQLGQGYLMASRVLGDKEEGFPPVKQPIAPIESGNNVLVAATIGASFELMTPRIYPSLAEPRFFAHVDAAAAFGFQRTIAGTGAPGDMEFKPGNAPTPGEEVVTGQGSRILAEVDPFVLTAGAGIAFTFKVWERTLRVKPSFEYIREELKITGIVNRAVRLESPGTSIDSYRLIELHDAESRVLHGIGPGIEFETEAGRAGPFMLGVYLSGQGYKFLGDLDLHLRDSNEYDEWAEWNFTKQEWGWGARVGLRFRWLPE
ncbi:MAG: hypothetical protein JRH19_06980 [Deltaproteobacteria bacterium]|nr:hypothetical protein [Deltaproteobacteria bacterium]